MVEPGRVPRVQDTHPGDGRRPPDMAHALQRRRAVRETELGTYLNGGLSIDFATQEVRIGGRRAVLAPPELKVLCQLARQDGSVVTSERLLVQVWGSDGAADPEFAKKCIHRLCAKLESDPAEPRLIVNRRGGGYMLAATR